MSSTGNLINGETLYGSFELGKRTGTLLTLETLGKYLDQKIELSLSAQSASPSFDGGALNSKAATATFTNLTTSATNTSGVEIQAIGAAGRDAVLYDGAVNGWVAASDNDPVSAAVATESWNGTKYYVTGVTLATPTTGTHSFSITVPNGNESPVSFTFTVDANGNTTIT